MRHYALLIFVSGMVIGIAVHSAADYFGLAVYPLPTSSKPVEFSSKPRQSSEVIRAYVRGRGDGRADAEHPESLEFQSDSCLARIDTRHRTVFIGYINANRLFPPVLELAIHLDNDGLPVLSVFRKSNLCGQYPLDEFVRAAENATTVKQKID